MVDDPMTPAPTPQDGDLPWRCFHCDESFTDEAEAREHFGATLYRDPACQLAPDQLKHIRGLEERNAELVRHNEELDNEARLWNEAESDRVRRIGNVQWWQEMDYREGEKIVLQEQLADARRQIAALQTQRDALATELGKMHEYCTRSGL